MSDRNEEQSLETEESHSMLLFLERAIALGIHDLKEIGDLILDPSLNEIIIKAAQHNPLKGTRLSVDDLVDVMEQRAKEVLLSESLKSVKE